jgi:hypothetical protein
MPIKGLTIFLITLLSFNAYADENPAYKIDADTAVRLVIETSCCKPLKTLSHAQFDKYKSRYWRADLTPNNDIPFFLFSDFDGAGAYAVNPWTGEVWDRWHCEKVDSPMAKKERTEIYKRFTPEEKKQYVKLALMKPECLPL